jgi:ParB-like chromosome segregation protein Spo0J
MSLTDNLKPGTAAISTPQPPTQKPSEPDKAMPEYTAHRFSEYFPPMTAEEIKVLGADILSNRLKEPIWLHDGMILDGNNRYRACLKIGYPLKETDFRKFDPATQGDPLKFVISANLHRRHLNESQRALIATRLVNSKLGCNQYNGAGVTALAAAQMLGVSEATVKMAKKVAEKGAPEILEQVQKGELRLGAANQVVSKSKDQQVVELAKIKAAADQRKADAKAARGAKPDKPKPPNKDDQRMAALDEFQARWRGLDDMQRKAFVTNFESDLAGLLDYVRQQKAMIGGTTPSVGS